MNTRKQNQDPSGPSENKPQHSTHAWRGQSVEDSSPIGEQPANGYIGASGGQAAEDLDEDEDTRKESDEIEEEKRRAAAEEHATATSKHGPHGRL